MDKKYIYIDDMKVLIENEKNILELIRKAHIEIPTFCYHSELSVYGACRLCVVEIEGMGVCASCSTPPRENMRIYTNTEKLRKQRKITIELLLANHDMNCTTCAKSTNCQLQAIAKRLGVDDVRFRKVQKTKELDTSSLSITRDPNKCVLCGDCVRFCKEVQSVGAIGFAYRGSKTEVTPAFIKDVADVECVNCGQCRRVCPTGAITIKNDTNEVWNALSNKDLTVVVQVAPAVRVALGESFGFSNRDVTGQMVAALRRLGFKQVYDTSFTADLTIFEEANEFVERFKAGEKLPLFTSCCPAWVKFMEHYYPDMLPHLSTCRSPQGMFGSIAKEFLPKMLGVDRKNLVVVSVMPCTAKKFEARQDKFLVDGKYEVDYVLTTEELANMINEAGIDFRHLELSSFDLPFGFKTGAGVIFGNTGGVTEAVLRYVYDNVTDMDGGKIEVTAVRGEEGIREAKLKILGKEAKIAIVYGLRNARTLLKQIKRGEAHYDFVEVMACPMGCVGGAGQPVNKTETIRKKRLDALYTSDTLLELHRSQDNVYINKLYEDGLGEIGGHKAHKLLHTHYSSKSIKEIYNLEE